jgi:hypothetical protein
MNTRTPRPVVMQLWMLRVLMWLFPTGFRKIYRVEMLQTYRTRATNIYARQGYRGLLRLWGTTVVDLGATAVREQFGSAKRWQRIGGMALIGGGMLWTMLHLPFGVGWFQSPPIAMALLMIGLASMNFERARAQHAAPLRMWAGFMVTAVGLMTVLAGYMTAWTGGWHQTGITTVAGAALQSVGLLVMGMTAHENGRSWPMLLITGLVSGGEAAWMALFLWQGMLMESMLSVLGLVIFGVMGGLCWAALGVTLWREGDEEVNISCGKASGRKTGGNNGGISI